MAKPRSFRCRALFTLDLAPKCGMEKGRALLGAREAGFGAAWAVLFRAGEIWPARCSGRYLRAGEFQVPGWNPHFRIWGRATEDGKLLFWAGREGRRGVFRRFSFRSRKEPPVAPAGTPAACSHLER